MSVDFQADRNQVDNEMSASFLALGLNLNNLGTPPFKTAGGVGQGASNHHPIHSAIPGPPPIILPPPPDRCGHSFNFYAIDLGLHIDARRISNICALPLLLLFGYVLSEPNA